MTLRATGIGFAQRNASPGTTASTMAQSTEGEGAAGINAVQRMESQRENTNAQIRESNKQGNRQLGSVIGGSIGMIWGPVGSMIGSAAGGLIGGLF
jgi:hypothetical protein